MHIVSYILLHDFVKMGNWSSRGPQIHGPEQTQQIQRRVNAVVSYAQSPIT